MSDSVKFERIHEILRKIISYQQLLADGRAVNLDELKRNNILTGEDEEFLRLNSVIYKPHKLSSYHRMDMFEIPTEEGGCAYIGPASRVLSRRSCRLRELRPMIDVFLCLPAQNDLILHFEFSENDGMAIAPELICFTFQSSEWINRLGSIREVAAGFALEVDQETKFQGGWTLSFRMPKGAGEIAGYAVGLLGRGCGFSEESEITYSAGALDEMLN